jgi:predicted Zn-dependent peptidase
MRFFKSLVLCVLLMLVPVNFCYAADTTSEVKIDVKEFHLKNGMLFLIVERPTTPQVACRLAIRAGSAL